MVHVNTTLKRLKLNKNGGIVMGVSRRAYQELIDGDIEWLLRQPRDLERDHIEAVLRKSVELLYGKEK